MNLEWSRKARTIIAFPVLVPRLSAALEYGLLELLRVMFLVHLVGLVTLARLVHGVRYFTLHFRRRWHLGASHNVLIYSICYAGHVEVRNIRVRYRTSFLHVACFSQNQS